MTGFWRHFVCHGHHAAVNWLSGQQTVIKLQTAKVVREAVEREYAMKDWMNRAKEGKKHVRSVCSRAEFGESTWVGFCRTLVKSRVYNYRS